ncbi:Uncharacterised protein [Mycobacteroides abscessus subsp. abscessus]|nr:Uncharacterised protein [Mycobacteroides abscessus subsp. abscessus]
MLVTPGSCAFGSRSCVPARSPVNSSSFSPKPSVRRTRECVSAAPPGFSARADSAVCRSRVAASNCWRTVSRPSLASASHCLRSSITLPWKDSRVESVVK